MNRREWKTDACGQRYNRETREPTPNVQGMVIEIYKRSYWCEQLKSYIEKVVKLQTILRNLQNQFVIEDL